MRRLRYTVPAGLVALLAACASAPTAGPSPALQPTDVRWLQRVSFGIDTASVDALQARGRERYLEWQLGLKGPELPDAVATGLGGGDLTPLATRLADLRAESQRIGAIADEPGRQAARRAESERANAAAYAAQRERLYFALYSRAQLREVMVSFWLNHFSVFMHKGELRWMLADYTDKAIRPHALGSFRDLLLAVETHPAMLQYLDNAQNAVGHVNENLAREMLELHTLGVNGGYSQQDVQQLARVLTGLGLDVGNPDPRLRPERRALLERSGGMEFNPARHDFGNKVLLGHTIRGSGLGELEQVVNLLVESPACAQFIAHKLAVHFLADEPDPAVVARAARAFHDSHGDIARTLKAILLASEMEASLGHKFKDPEQFVLSALRLGYDGRVLVNLHPVVNWLGALNEPLYGHLAPDGYADDEPAWASSGQLERRFEIARTIGSGHAGLFEPEDGTSPAQGGFPTYARPVYYQAMAPLLSAATLKALDSASSQQEWNTLLLSSPDFNFH